MKSLAAMDLPSYNDFTRGFIGNLSNDIATMRLSSGDKLDNEDAIFDLSGCATFQGNDTIHDIELEDEIDLNKAYNIKTMSSKEKALMKSALDDSEMTTIINL